MTFEILLANDDDSRSVYERVYDYEDGRRPDLAILASEMTCVGTIIANDKDDAFMQLQNGVVWDSWSLLALNVTLNDTGKAKIEAQRGLGLRSLSVGDILHVPEAGLLAGYFLCIPNGWRHMELDLKAKQFITAPEPPQQS